MVALRVTDVATIGLTVTVHVADTVPQVAVMVAVPTFLAVTNPVASTVATASSLDFQVTVLLVVFSGVTVAVS